MDIPPWCFFFRFVFLLLVVVGLYQDYTQGQMYQYVSTISQWPWFDVYSWLILSIASTTTITTTTTEPLGGFKEGANPFEDNSLADSETIDDHEEEAEELQESTVQLQFMPPSAAKEPKATSQSKDSELTARTASDSFDLEE
jgi:hypothetical protein